MIICVDFATEIPTDCQLIGTSKITKVPTSKNKSPSRWQYMLLIKLDLHLVFLNLILLFIVQGY